nr:uncharacterized protein LOC123771300 [Procambarus clarkii]
MVSSLPITVTFILVVLVSWVFSQTAKCFIDCKGFNAGVHQTADPLDCHNYYMCTSPTTYNPNSVACPDGQDFNIVNNVCSNQTMCTPPCERCSTSCSPGCINRAAFPGDCSRYYECDGNGGIIGGTHICGVDAPYFDGFTCQTDQQNCCSCKAECTEQDVDPVSMIADTANCTNYYICYVVGIADETYHGHCPTGNFDQLNQKCSNSADCSSYYCQNLYGCYEELTCSETGYFPKCKRACDRHYFYCSQIGELAELMTCINSHVLNVLTMECVAPSECPFPSRNVMP